MTILELQTKIHEKQLLWLRLDRLVKQSLFVEFFESALPKDKEKICELLDALRLDELEQLMKQIVEADLTEYSRRELVVEARKYYIKNYGMLSKSELIMAIRQAKIMKEDCHA